MQDILNITKKELKLFFITPLFYIVFFIFALMTGIDFFFGSVVSGEGDFRFVLFNTATLLFLLVPIITMRVVSEERKRKTIEVLLSMPISLKKIILGKFLSVVAVVCLFFLFTLLHLVVLIIASSPDYTMLLLAYLGLFLHAMALVSIGFFISTVTESQVMAVVVSIVVNLAIFLTDVFGNLFLPPVSTFLKEISFFQHLSVFFQGIFSLKDICYFLMIFLSGIFLSMNYFNREKYRN